jgi:DNA-binding MarR family transcriptional regulator
VKRAAKPFYDGGHYEPGESVGSLMHGVTARMRRRIERRMAELGLTAAQWKPLWLLARGEVDTAQALTCATETDAGAMTRMLDRLEAKGLIERERSAADRRVVTLRLTKAGHEVVDHIPYVLAEVNNLALRQFSAAEYTQFVALLKRMNDTLSEEEGAA